MTAFQTDQGRVEIRELAGIDQMLAAERLQVQVWGADVCPHPKEILIPVQHEGGLLAGAFEPHGAMVALIFGFPTRDPAVQHSQLLATLEPWRGLGIGERLKWFQRGWCLERGIKRVRWTVDPLRAVNAVLNIQRLGAVSSAYLPDYYGPMQGIDAGAPTDRLLVEWPLEEARVKSRALSPEKSIDTGFPGVAYANRVDGGSPVGERLDIEDPRVLVRIPDDFIRLSKADPVLSLAWRRQTRALFLAYLGLGYRVNGFTRAGGPAYLLEKEEGWTLGR